MKKSEIIYKLKWLADEGRSLGTAEWTAELLAVVLQIAKYLPDDLDDNRE